MRRIIVLPEELQVVVDRLEKVEKALKTEQRNIEDPILDSEGVMKLLNISRRTLQTLRDERLIEFSQVNGKFFYRMTAINRMLDNHIRKTTDL
jgi:hypothetical protein